MNPLPDGAAGGLGPVQPADLPALRALMTRVIVTRVTTDPVVQAQTIENVMANLAWWEAHRDESCHLRYTVGGQVVGVVLVKKFWNLCSLFVAPEFHRRGIGRMLVLAAIEDCRSRGTQQAIWLNAAPDAVAFYRALGFTDRASTQALPPGFLPMQLPLAVPAGQDPGAI